MTRHTRYTCLLSIILVCVFNPLHVSTDEPILRCAFPKYLLLAQALEDSHRRTIQKNLNAHIQQTSIHRTVHAIKIVYPIALARVLLDFCKLSSIIHCDSAICIFLFKYEQLPALLQKKMLGLHNWFCEFNPILRTYIHTTPHFELLTKILSSPSTHPAPQLEMPSLNQSVYL